MNHYPISKEQLEEIATAAGLSLAHSPAPHLVTFQAGSLLDMIGPAQAAEAIGGVLLAGATIIKISFASGVYHALVIETKLPPTGICQDCGRLFDWNGQGICPACQGTRDWIAQAETTADDTQWSYWPQYNDTDPGAVYEEGEVIE